MDSEFLKSITESPEVFYILKTRKTNGLIFETNKNIVESLKWNYTHFLKKDFLVFLPSTATVEALERITLINGVIIFTKADQTLNELVKWNKRRANTILKNISKKNQVILLTSMPLKCLELPILEIFETISNIPENFSLESISYFDFVDQDESTFDLNIRSLVDLIEEHSDKKIYLSLNSVPNEFICLLKHRNIKYSKSGTDSQLVIHSCKTTLKSEPQKADVYIYSLPMLEHPLDVLYYFHDPNGIYYLDSNNLKNIRWCFKSIYNTSTEEKTVIKDSKEFDTYESIETELEKVVVSEGYYTFRGSETIQNMDLSNLKKSDSDIIRNFIKVKMTSKYDIELKTCQIASPSSPRDRSRKLNSLSNKISCFDYRCDATCEIFKDYSIGVVVWNDVFKNRKEINVLKNSAYVYQTTAGKWKFTNVY